MTGPANPPTLTYFPIPGRGEISRLLFTLGNVEFVDKRIPQAEWPALKAATPFGQLPVLEVGGKQFAESNAIDHYAARVAGLLPEDPVAALAADEAYYFVIQDIHNAHIAPINRLPDPDQQVKARQELVAGPLKDKLALLSKLVESRPGKYLAGDKISHGDVAVFNQLSAFKSGLWKGIPTDILDSYPALKAFRHQIASLPQVAAYYAQATDDTRKNGYTPDPVAQ